MERHLVIILIAFFSGIFASDDVRYFGERPCPASWLKDRIVTGFYKKSFFYFAHADLMKDRIIAGFYKKSFFYFVHGNDRKIQLDPKTLFGEIGIPATATYTINRLVPVNGNRVIIFFEQSDKLFYAFYELDDLTYHAKNGSARVLQSLHSQEKHEVKFADGSNVRKEEFDETIKRETNKLVLGKKDLQGIDLNICDSWLLTSEISFHVKAEEKEDEVNCFHSVRQEKDVMLTCINGQTVDFALGRRTRYVDDFAQIDELRYFIHWCPRRFHPRANAADGLQDQPHV
uniref:LAM_G_DOMAIN domain-containing protein n=1 Tax=Steinernema glaseri TaxID=37863 RepID=A0A1I8AJW1_9BILA